MFDTDGFGLAGASRGVHEVGQAIAGTLDIEIGLLSIVPWLLVNADDLAVVTRKTLKH